MATTDDALFEDLKLIIEFGFGKTLTPGGSRLNRASQRQRNRLAQFAVGHHHLFKPGLTGTLPDLNIKGLFKRSQIGLAQT